MQILLSVRDPAALVAEPHRLRLSILHGSASKHFLRSAQQQQKNRPKGQLFMLAVRARRIELPSTGWKPVILPLNYARNTLSITVTASIADLVNNINLKGVSCRQQFFGLRWFRIRGFRSL